MKPITSTKWNGWAAILAAFIKRVASNSFNTAQPLALDEYLFQPRELFEYSELIPRTLKKYFLAATDALIEEVKRTWHTDFEPLRLHGDCHPGNILWRDGPLFVDLDDARNGPAVQDIWMLLNGDKANSACS
ncbi:serine/threonine protein kinase [Cedecea neteri]|uniref:Serine/threonine protein kinase n=1 Tax=Cedecea neteri TaxID=158822 RepID=A0A2X2T952_9ENTR|nr:serine/threonine protein kinase [Cedecea neteri]